MIDKTSTNERNYQKKITAYLDGSLSPNERSEFEAYVAVNPQFKTEIKGKEEEIERLRSLIPKVEASPRTIEGLESEVKQSALNLLKREPRNIWENLKDRYEEWTANRSR